MITINIEGGSTVNIDRVPDTCPFCHKNISAIPIFGVRTEKKLNVIVSCPSDFCREVFIAYYRLSISTFSFQNKTSQGNKIGKEFSKDINLISVNFVKIYNEAFSAEQYNLKEICGVGYRKALEFLIKDYIISKDSALRDVVGKKSLGACIKDHINDIRITNVVKRAVWLGNDETHYIRKWDDKNLHDLKALINLTLHWIEMNILTEKFETDMPE